MNHITMFYTDTFNFSYIYMMGASKAEIAVTYVKDEVPASLFMLQNKFIIIVKVTCWDVYVYLTINSFQVSTLFYSI